MDCLVKKKDRMFNHLQYMVEGNASRMPWPKLASRYALKSGCLSQQNLPAAGPDVKLKPQKPPPIFSSGVNKGSGHLPGSSAWDIAIFSLFPPSPTVM